MEHGLNGMLPKIIDVKHNNRFGVMVFPRDVYLSLTTKGACSEI